MSPLDDFACVRHLQFDNGILVGVFFDQRHFAAHEFHTHRFGVLVELFVAFAEGADVHVIDGDVSHWQSARNQHGLFDGVHATDTRAIGDAECFVARTCALNVGNGGGFLAIAWTQDTTIRSRRCEETFHHQRVNHVMEFARAVFFFGFYGGQVEACRHDDGGGFDVEGFRLLREINCINGAGLFAFAAPQTIFVDQALPFVEPRSRTAHGWRDRLPDLYRTDWAQ